jgi:ribonuclease HI
VLDEDAHAAYVPTPKAEPEPDLFSLLDSEGLLGEDAAPTAEQRVIALERDLLRDDIRADPAAVAALLHPDWMEVGRSGRLWDREEMLATIAPLTDPVTLDVISVTRVDDDVVLLLWRASTDQRITLRSSVWVRDGPDWRQRFHQGTDES